MSHANARARNPNAATLAGETPATNEAANEVTLTETAEAKPKRELGPKIVYIQLKEGVDKECILSVHTNTRTLVDAMESAPGSSYVKKVLPQGEPRKRNG